MKQKEFEQAREMYFQTNMSKTEIATKLGVNRRTVLLWCKQDNWERLRQASNTMPSIIAEKIYYLLDNFLTQCLRDPDWTFATYKDSQTIYLLTSSIKKLKNRKSAINETMETFGALLEGLKKRKPELAEQITPELEEYLSACADKKVSDHYMDGVNEFGGMGFKSDEEEQEERQDKADLAEFQEELKAAGGNYDQALENWQQKPPAETRPWVLQNQTPPPETNTNTTT